MELVVGGDRLLLNAHFGSYPYPPNFLFKNVNEYIIIVQKPDPKRKYSSTFISELFRSIPR